MQKLILSANNTILTAAYKNPEYENLIVNGVRMGTHYGWDFVGDYTLYASGNGTVISTGYDNIFGYYVVVKYDSVYNHSTKSVTDVVIRYFHLSFIKCRPGQNVTKDTVIGRMGNTGKYVTGTHCHIEIDYDAFYWQYTPSLSVDSNIFKAGLRGDKDTTVNPHDILHVKTSKPDYQKISRLKDVYSTEDDIKLPIIKE